MKISSFVLGVVIGCAAMALGPSMAQEAGEEGGGGGGIQRPEWTMQTEHHKEMAKSVGEFDVAGEMYGAPGSPPMPWTASSKRELICGGNYLQETMTADFDGMPFEGRLIQGYDTVRKKGFSLWIDNMSPVPAVKYGEGSGAAFVSYGKDPGWVSGKLKHTMSVGKQNEDGSMVIEFFDLTSEGNRLTMRMAYKRKK